MKKIVLAAAFAAFATGATAGGMDDPIVEEPVSPPPVEEVGEGNSTSILPILLLFALAILAAN